MRVLAALVMLALIPFAALADKKSKDQVLVTFAGSVKRITKKEILIETDGDNQMTFVRTKRTVFQSGGRAIDGAGVPQGITVNVQAFERLNRELEAVTVTVAIPDQVPNK